MNQPDLYLWPVSAFTIAGSDTGGGAGIEMIGNEQPSQGRGRGVRLKEPT